ncbi:MAG: 5'-nucleotidase C-terminal domain-containing protein [Paracoccus sp. (in: a-proteobacteria)]|nr:5'-nucleotidase C-terminal domain-containing protein [Paracoccus sp. (in: a-proteobacteria)]
MGQPPAGSLISLRIIATTDLHMHLGAEGARGGLARLARLIAAERDAHDNLLLFDNGDLLDGSALADDLARAGLGAHDIHPAIAALNRLGYDGATLGNHDFAHGVEFLRRVLRDARYPLVLANAGLVSGAPLWREGVLLSRRMRAADGGLHDLNIGIFGVLPPQTTDWEAGLGREMRTEDIMTASRRAVSALRAQGADVIIALSHGGIGAGDPGKAENAADAIAGMAGVDAVIAGHTHEVTVSPAAPGCAPVVNAGFGGSHLAAITLRLQGQAGDWRTDCLRAEAVQAPSGPGDAALSAVLPPENARMQAAIGWARRPLSSHFSLLGCDAGLRLTEAALRAHVARHLPGSAGRLLTALAPFRTGGRGGPDHFAHIPAGTIRRGDLSVLYPFTNHAAVIEVSGAEIADWLERAASVFSHLPGPETGARPLIEGSLPGFHLDMIGGLDYEIDLSQPALFDAAGHRLGAAKARAFLPATAGAAGDGAGGGGGGDHDGASLAGGRVRRIRHQGRVLDADDRFLMITNSYRMTGGPLYAPLTTGKRCLLPAAARIRVRHVLAAYLGTGEGPEPDSAPFFRLRAAHGTKAWFDTAPGADPAVCPLAVVDRRITETGFQRLTLQF